MPAPRPARLGIALLGTAFTFALLAGAASAHDAYFQLAGKKVEIKTSGKTPKFSFQTDKKQVDFSIRHDPVVDGFSILVVGSTGRTAYITLDPSFWKAKGKSDPPKAWKYKDKTGSRGGITDVQLKAGSIKIKGKGPNWDWSPEDVQDEVWVWTKFEGEWFCSQFGGEPENGSVQKNEAGHYRARKADAPGACPIPTCGNKEREAGEDCDDGNKDEEDGCTLACTAAACDGEDFETTFDAIQSVVLEGYGCTSSICHGQVDHVSNMSLYPEDPDGNWDAIVGVQSTAKPEWNLVEVSDIETSFLYEKLAAATFPDVVQTTGTPMPSGGMLTPEHLEAMELWIRGGAPRDGIVEGTAELLETCLPPPTPLKVDPPEPPGAGVGVQLRSSAWSLPAESENEVCISTYYDFTQTTLIPEEQQFDCPEWIQTDVTNPTGKCFRYHRQLLLQDPQSHHSIIHLYTGESDTSDPGWGAWTFKMNDPEDALNGTSCDPLAIDPATGYHDGCSGDAVRNAACVFGYGPSDWSTGFAGGPGTAPQFSGSQEAHYLQEFADGVYSVLPMAGIVVYNSHAFNLTTEDTTMAQYLNLDLAAPEDQLYPTQQIFDADNIFVQDVPPFEAIEYCDTYEIPQYANLFWLSSHTHIRGVRWRTWLPPNQPCTPSTCTPGDPADVDYVSTIYNDPLQLAIDPPIPYDSPDPADRTILYCSLFDNGSTPDSPPVKRFSTSPVPPLPIGGPCAVEEVACYNEGPNKGALCGLGGSLDDSLCDSSPGSGDGVCDACPLRGGFTTEDEMFILLGNYFVD